MLPFYIKYRIELLSSFICLLCGMVPGFFVKGGKSDWYINLSKPFFSPPNWIFGPVWTALYIMMGIAFAKLIIEKKKNFTLITLFIIQFIFNLAWSPLFFYFQNISLALFDIALLWSTILIFMILSIKQRLVFFLLLPYIMWVSFAFTINFSLYILNI